MNVQLTKTRYNEVGIYIPKTPLPTFSRYNESKKKKNHKFDVIEVYLKILIVLLYCQVFY